MPIAGTALSVRHYRNNTECGKMEELPPIDENLAYDFDYQVSYYKCAYAFTDHVYSNCLTFRNHCKYSGLAQSLCLLQIV